MLKKYQTLLLILLSYIVLLAFYPSITANFINLDDCVMVTENPNITSLSFSNIKYIFSTIHYKLYHPIVTLSYAIEYYFCGLDPYLYHVDNILLHLLNVLLIFFIIRKLSKNIFVAYISALLFAIHPVHVEVVSWITSRKDTLYSFFFLLSILFYLKIDDNKYSKYMFVFSIISFIASCMSKPMAITLPFILVLIDFYNGKLNFNRIKKYIPFIIMTCIFVYIAIISHYSIEEKTITTIFVRFTNFIDAHFNYLFYIYKTFVPINLSCLYPQFYNHYNSIPLFILLSPMILYVIIYCVIFSLKFNKKIFFGFFFFLITLLPSSGIMPTGVSPVADRYIYLPLLGLIYIASEFLFYIYKQDKYKKYIVILFVFILSAILFYLTYQRNIVWSDNEKLMTEAINYSPETTDHAYLMRGCFYKSEQKLDDAEQDFKKSLSINPQNAYTVFHYGHLKQMQKKFQDARKLYAYIPKYSSNYIATINNLAILLEIDNKSEEAIKLIQDLLAETNDNIIPDYIYHTLAVAYYNCNDFENSKKCLNLAINVNPTKPDFYLELMLIYKKENNLAEFEKIAIQGLNNTSKYFEISNKLIEYYFLNEKYLKSEELLLESINLYPNNHFAYFVLGNILAIKYDYKKALILYTISILLSKNYGEYYFKRAAIYLILKKYDLAKKDIEKAEKYNFKFNKEFKMELENIKIKKEIVK